MINQGLFLAILAAFCMTGSIYADTGSYSCSTSTSPFAGYNASACQAKSLLNYGGHLESGFLANQYGQKNSYTTRSLANGRLGIDPLSGNTMLLQNTAQSDLQLNQAMFYVEKLRRKCGWDWGARVDYIYGTDARFWQSEGLERNASHGDWGSGDYYSALSQMYAELGCGNFSVKVGKFGAPSGSDAMYSPDRFFYSLSKNTGLLPVTHTGALAQWISGDTTYHVGWTQGTNRFFETSEDNALIFGFERKLDACTSFGYSGHWGRDTYNTEADYYTHVLYVNRKLGCRWDYRFDWAINNREFDNGDSATAYGINNSLYYKLSCDWSVGFRAEWLHTNNYGIGAFGADGSDMYGFVLGANWKPCDWFVLRPEIRHDSVHGDPGPFNIVKGNQVPGRSGQLAGGVSAIVIF